MHAQQQETAQKREDGLEKETIVVHRQRNIRTLSGVLGLSFLVNYVFYRAQRDEEK